METNDIKVLLYTGSEKLLSKSGIGEAIRHQKKMLEALEISYTENTNEDYDVVHLNTVLPDSFWMARKARSKGKKVIYYGHSTMEDFRNSFRGSNLVAPAFKKWLELCYRQGDIIITPTAYSKNLLLRYAINRPIVSLSNGVDTTFFAKKSAYAKRFREQYALSQDQKVVMSVGHLIDRKGVTDFIDLAKKFPQYTFFWFGHTPKSLMTPAVQKAIAQASDNLHFPGYISAEELRDAYSGSDLFLFMTYEETEGIVLLEALANETPVLVRDIPIYKEWLKEGKSVYKAKVQDDFERKLPMILEGELPSLTQAGLQEARALDLKAVSLDLAKIYQQLFYL